MGLQSRTRGEFTDQRGKGTAGIAPTRKSAKWTAEIIGSREGPALAGRPSLLDLNRVLQIPDDVVDRGPLTCVAGDAAERQLGRRPQGVVGEGALDGGVNELTKLPRPVRQEVSQLETVRDPA